MLGEVLTATVTPFQADGSVDLDAFRALARYLVDNGSDGLVVTGTTGESPTLSDKEREELWAAALEEVGDRATVVAGTGTYSTEHSVHLTERAHALGVDGFLVVTPYYNKPPPRGTVEHFKTILRYYHGLAKGKPSGWLDSIVRTLIQVARYHVEVSADVQAELKRIASKLPPRSARCVTLPSPRRKTSAH